MKRHHRRILLTCMSSYSPATKLIYICLISLSRQLTTYSHTHGPVSCNCTARARTGEWCSCSRAGRSPSGPGTIRHAPPPTAHLIRSFLLEAVAGLMPGLVALVAVAAETAAPALQQQTKTSCNKSPAATCGLGVDVCLPCTYVRERRLERMAARARAAITTADMHAAAAAGVEPGALPSRPGDHQLRLGGLTAAVL